MPDLRTVSKVDYRVFKTGWFNKGAKKAGIDDAELCVAVRQVMAGQADDLGGGVCTARSSRPRAAAIGVYEYLFARKDQANIDDDELAGFRLLAKGYANLTVPQVAQLIADKLRQVDQSCVAVPPDIGSQQIKLIREQAHVSQPVFARYLNTSESTVQKWEAGTKKPSGMALKLLAIVQKHGPQVLV